MDHATRHLSSPSPTSSFLFQQTEKSYKSSASDLLAPLLSSETDNSDVDACFSVAPTAESRTNITFSPNHSDDDSRTRYKHSNETNDCEILGNTNESHNDETDDGVALILRQFSESERAIVHQNAELNSASGHCSENDRLGDDIKRDEEEDDDEDDEDMRNVLSGSSRSSATTMPLLTDAHNHHSFSERISLEEYSPLSLVNDCDNALPMSPTSLACGSHHSSFKSSLNNLKLDHLGVDGVGDVGVHVVDDVVGDTRSMSPSLLSNPNPHHSNNLWSTSSTAISQNPSLLTGTSTSIILLQHSHHPNQHSHQLSSFMQQLEPQCLNESPNILNNNSNLDSDLSGSHNVQTVIDRPSSEPPITSGPSVLGEFEAKAAFSSGSASTSIKLTASSSLNNRSKKSFSCLSSNTTSLPSANTNLISNTQITASSCTTSTRSSSRSRNPRQRVRSNKSNQVENTARLSNPESIIDVKPHCSKLHLQLNHHKKLKELQQRLFGNLSTATGNTDNASEVKTETVDKLSVTKLDTSVEHESKEEADSSANNESADSSPQSAIKEVAISKSIVENSKGAMTKSPRRATKRKKQDKTQSSSDDSPHSSRSNNSDSTTSHRSNFKCVKTETAEPDTTTKSSDCLKLADLLSSGSSVDILRANSNFGLVLSSDAISRLGSGQNNNGEKKIQHIQVNPSLSIVAGSNLSNNEVGLVPHTGIQQHFQRSDGILVGNSGQTNTSLASLVNTENISTGNQLKCNVITSSDANPNDIPKRNTKDESSNWTTNYNIQCNLNTTNETITNNLNQTAPNNIGAHQIAIQVICQDGTSLVLPVSTATSINTAVALSTQNQAQLQALLASNNSSVLISNCQQAQRANGPQLFPVVTMINSQSNVGASMQTQNSHQTNGSTSGLAASSPTLAALLDAGSSRAQSMINRVETQQNFQSAMSSNLLRKIVATTPTTQNQTGCSSNNGAKATLDLNDAKKTGSDTVKEHSLCTATLATIEPQGANVTNNNENGSNNSGDTSKDSNDSVKRHDTIGNKIVTKPTTSDRQPPANSFASNDTVTPNSENIKTNNKDDNSTDCLSNKQIAKMTSSTGNRQVDPAQPFRCEHCDSTFTRLGNFTRHKKIHTVPTKDGQRFKCDVCSKSFLQRCDLARHLHIHRGTEPHRCNICGKGYIRHSDLVTHQRFHNKEKPFGCPHCSKGFCQRGDLNRHLRSIHLQMKPILCPCCNRKFAKQETLLRHLNSAHRGNNKPAATISGIQVNPTESASSVASSKKQDSHHNGLTNDSISSDQKDVEPTNTDFKSSQPNLSTATVNQKTSTSVASLQAIQATLSKVQQNSLEQSNKIRAE